MLLVLVLQRFVVLLLLVLLFVLLVLLLLLVFVLLLLFVFVLLVLLLFVLLLLLFVEEARGRYTYYVRARPTRMHSKRGLLMPGRQPTVTYTQCGLTTHTYQHLRVIKRAA